MSLVRIHPDPSRRQLAVFGVVWLVFFAVVGVGALKHGRPAAAVAFWTTAILVPAIGGWSPRFMRVLYLGMAYATFPIGFVLSWLLLAAVYYLVVTPTGIVMRAIGHDPLKRFDDAGAESYWIPREPDEGLDDYFRQF